MASHWRATLTIERRSNLRVGSTLKISNTTKGTGIAKTTAGGVAIAAGGSTIAGILLAPVTAGASLALTVTGIAGGVAAAGTSITSTWIKNSSIENGQKAIQNALERVDQQEIIVNELFTSLQNNMAEMRNLMQDPDNLQRVLDFTRGIMNVGRVAYRGYTLYNTVEAVRFARQVAAFIQADFYAMAGIAQVLFFFFIEALFLVRPNFF
jgi:hypothetical protein